MIPILTWLMASVLVLISSAIPSSNDNATGILGLWSWGWGSNELSTTKETYISKLSSTADSTNANQIVLK